MKGNAVKIIVLVILCYIAFLSLKKGITAFNAKPGQTDAPPEEVLTEEIPAEMLLSEATDGADTGAATDTIDAFTSLSDYGNAPFLTQQESQDSTQDTSSSFSGRSFDTAQLTTIINYEEEWRAVINGTLVKKGDSLGRLKIAAIDENSATIEEAGKTYKLRLWQEAAAK
ncbi:MAG: hypothetical protein FJZ10_06770 [Candidatus Omnitrophica bacterium]|nr:hypothetical protein [Candidatus Omnitrophota bacterium]